MDASGKLMCAVRDQQTTAKDIVETWHKLVVTTEKPLALVYLANDLIQKSKIKKTADFNDWFYGVIAEVLVQLKDRVSDHELKAMIKVVDVWLNRKIYEKDWLESLKHKLTAFAVEVPDGDIIKLADFGPKPLWATCLAQY